MKIVKSIYLFLVYAFLYVPIIIVIAYAFNNVEFSLLWHGFTLKWFGMLWNDSAILTVAWHSLVIAVLASIIACVLGTLIATCLHYYKFFGKELLNTMVLILLMAPSIVIAVSLLLLYDLIHLPLGFWSLLLSHVCFCVPFVTVIVLSRMVTLDRSLVDAAKDLGSTDWNVLRMIIIPLVAPSIVSGGLLSCIMSIDDVIISYFVSGPTYGILPLKIYSMVKLGVKPEINALCAVMLLITLIVVFLSQLVIRKKA
jgi:spermidine/putrescine transport system permease protein